MKIRIEFVGRLAGIVLCACGFKMKKHGETYSCENPDCTHREKKFKAIMQTAVLLYEAKA